MTLNERQRMIVPCHICGEPLPTRGNVAHAHFQWHADEWFIKQGFRRIEVFQYLEKINVERVPLPENLEFQRTNLGSLEWREPDLQYQKDKEVVLGDVIVGESHGSMLKKAYIMHQILAQMPTDLKKRVVFYEPFEWLTKAYSEKKQKKDFNWYEKRGVPGCKSYRDVAYAIQRRASAREDLKFEMLELR